MNSLSNTIYSVISQSVEQFSQILSEKYTLSKDEIINLWNNEVSVELHVKPNKKPKTLPTVVTNTSVVSTSDEQLHTEKKNEGEKPEKKVSKSLPVCKYEFKKGKNSGTKCTSKVSSIDSDYCRKHKPSDKEDEEEKEEKKEVEKKTIKPKSDNTNSSTTSAVVTKLNESKPSYVLPRNKYGNYEHPDTHLVFDKVTREVYGKQVEDRVESLTPEDIELCRKLNFKCRLPLTLSKTRVEEDEKEEETEYSSSDEEVSETDDEDD